MPFNEKSLRNLAQNRAHRAEKNRALPITADSVLPIEIQHDASEILKNAAPDAALLLARLTRGGIRAPVHVRVQAARSILESQGLLGQQRRETPPNMPSLDTLRQALELRRRTAEAVDATVITVEGKA